MAAYSELKFINIDLGRDHSPVPPNVKPIIWRKDAFVENLKRCL